MFPCRMCSENPFFGLFGAGGAETAAKKRGGTRRQNYEARSEEEVEEAVRCWEEYVHPRAREYFGGDQRRMAEVLTLMAKSVDRNEDPVLGSEDRCVIWCGEVAKIGSSITSDRSDGERGGGSGGSVAGRRRSEESASGSPGSYLHKRQAVFKMVKPNEQEATVTYVNRVLAFTFAADDSFEQLMKLPKEPFRMACRNQLCVHIAHISLDP